MPTVAPQYRSDHWSKPKGERTKKLGKKHYHIDYEGNNEFF